MNNTNFASILLKGCGFSSAPRINNYNKKCRSLLPICEADVPLFLSAMYNKKYTSEKMTSRCPQSGRSMIEMLGVLAIIGVLSVGGIAGYSKAMMKYRINKTIEQVTLTSQNIRTFFSSQQNNKYEGIGSWNQTARDIIKKAKLVPDEMMILTDGKLTALQNGFGLWSYVYGWFLCYDSNCDNLALNESFIIDNILPSEEACIEFATQDWNAAASGVVAVSVGMVEAAYLGCEGWTDNGPEKAVACTNGSYLSIPMPLDVAAAACGKLYKDEEKYYVDIMFQ